MNKDNYKICFAASSGGHYEQLMMLKPIMKKYNGFIITEKTLYNTKVDDINYYYMKQVNRKELMCIPKMVLNFIKSIKIFIKEKPDMIICTGVLAMIPMCLIMKVFRKKLVYIESFAKITSPTISGKFLYKYADKFYVQWESMKNIYPESIYIGSIY